MGRCNVAMAVLVMLVVAGLHQQCEAGDVAEVSFYNNAHEEVVVLDSMDNLVCELGGLFFRVTKKLANANFITVKLQSGGYAKVPLIPEGQLRMRPSSVEVSSPEIYIKFLVLIGTYGKGVLVQSIYGNLRVDYEVPDQRV